MSCATCGHTMHMISDDHGDRTYWCPRCGTIKRSAFGKVDIKGQANGKPPVNEEAEEPTQLGITEAIALPEERPA